jgi:hypothetical protein
MLAAGWALTACANPGNTTASTFQETTTMAPATSPVVTTGELAPLGDPAIRARMNIRPVEWPLRFKSHQFGARCYDTLECDVRYYDQRINHGDPKPTRSSASFGTDYLKGWNGGYGGIKNFPPPARVKWRSKDGASHEAEIDIGELFKDELVRHNVPREEVSDEPDGKWENEPSILLEVNDRTIRVYTSAHIPTKHLQIPGNQYSGFRNDLIMVKTYTY